MFATGFSTAIASQIGGIFTSPPAPTVTSTDVRYIRLFDEKGKPTSGFTVDPRTRRHGNCGQSSFVSVDPGAFRCIDGANSSYLFDPCRVVWGRSSTDKVGCLETPWSRKIVMVSLSSNPNWNDDKRTPQPPWSLEVQDPRGPRMFLRCTYQGGVNTPIAGQLTPWKCVDKNGRHVGWIVGQIDDRGIGPWKVYFAADGSDQIVRTSVRTAWQ